MKTIALDISVLNDRQRTGIAKYTYDLIEALLRINHHDQFILFGFSTFDSFDELNNLPLKNYDNVQLKIFKMPARFFRTFFLIWQKFNWPNIEKFTGSIDIFHSFNWYFPPTQSAKTVATVFDMTPLLFPKWHQKKTVQLDRARLLKIKQNADLVITISENSKKDFLRFSANNHIEVIYPGVSSTFLHPSGLKQSKQILSKYQINRPFFLSVGTLEPRKNIPRLIEAYLSSAVSDKLVLVGNWGWENHQLADLIKSHSDKIITTGFVPENDLPYLYNNASALIYPSFYEGFGLPLIEAQASGCAVICADNSSLHEVAGTAALYIDANSTADLASAIVKVKSLREKLIQKGYQNVKRFSWDKSAKQLNQLYQQL